MKFAIFIGSITSRATTSSAMAILSSGSQVVRHHITRLRAKKKQWVAPRPPARTVSSEQHFLGTPVEFDYCRAKCTLQIAIFRATAVVHAHILMNQACTKRWQLLSKKYLYLNILPIIIPCKYLYLVDASSITEFQTARLKRERESQKKENTPITA